MNEVYLRQLVQEILSEAAMTFASVADAISKQSAGVYKPGAGRGGGHVRLSVDTESSVSDARSVAKAMTDEGYRDILASAGFEVLEVLPPKAITAGREVPFSGSFKTYMVRPTGDASSELIPVVFAGAQKTKKEEIAIGAINDQIKAMSASEKTKYILLSPNPLSSIEEVRRPRFVLEIKIVTGTPKADAVATGWGADDNIYLSLKGGSTAKHHQQWSGFTQFSEINVTRDFVKSIVGMSEIRDGEIHLPKGEKSALPFHQALRDSPDEEMLKVKGVYGPDAFPIIDGGFGINKVHIVVQSDHPKVVEVEGAIAERLRSDWAIPDEEKIYTLEGAHKVSYPNIPAESYSPHMHARYDSSSKLKIAQFLDPAFMKKVGLDPNRATKGVRFLIFPRDKLPKNSQDVSRYGAAAFGTVEERLVRKYIRNMIIEEASIKKVTR